jgi:hypothetical protein
MKNIEQLISEGEMYVKSENNKGYVSHYDEGTGDYYINMLECDNQPYVVHDEEFIEDGWNITNNEEDIEKVFNHYNESLTELKKDLELHKETDEFFYKVNRAMLGDEAVLYVIDTTKLKKEEVKKLLLDVEVNEFQIYKKIEKQKDNMVNKMATSKTSPKKKNRGLER